MIHYYVFFVFLVNAFLDTRERTVSPHTPRVVLLGPTGSGKSLQAAQLSDKYRLVNSKWV